jgi:hypothetical protein
MATKNKYTDIDLSKYSQGYKASSVVNAAEAQKKAAENAVANYGDFKYSNQDAYDKAMNSYLNREDFKYDLNADALYQQYKNQYATMGKMAMMDTMGQAAALTGGYGNSYASTAGNQAYQGYLQNLNDVIPELYQLALDKYNTDGDKLLNNYNMLSQDRTREYGEWGDRYNQLVSDRGYYADNYSDVYNRDYGTWNDSRTYDTDMYWNEYNTGYQADRDAIADKQWQDQFDESVRQYNASLAEQQRQFDAEMQWAKDQAKKESVLKNVSNKVTNVAKKVADAAKDAVTSPKNTPKGFTGKSYSEAVAYTKSKGVDNKYAASILTAGEFSRWQHKNEFSNYQEYLKYVTEDMVEQYAK